MQKYAIIVVLCVVFTLSASSSLAWTPVAVTNDALVHMPGTQPRQVVDLESDKQCLSCHGGYSMDHWRGSMMGQASRDPIFWASMTVAAQDSVWALGTPNAADLCLRCHFPMGWLDGRSDPPNASLMRGEDYEGVSCKICHYMYSPHFKTLDDGTREGSDWSGYWDEAGSLSATQASNTYSADAAAAATILRFDGNPFFSNNVPFSTNYTENAGGQYFVVTDDYSTGTRDAKRASFADANAKHAMLYSRYHKSRDICGTCHDVSNPALHNFEAPATNALPSERDPAYSYYHIERTFSEFILSGYGTNGGMAGSGPYDPSVFTTSRPSNNIASCQDCHFYDLPDGTEAGSGGVERPGGSSEHPKSGVPEHWMTGGNAWVPAILASTDPVSSNYSATNAALLGQGAAVLTLDLSQGEALDPVLLLQTSARAHAQLQSAVSITNTAYALTNSVLSLRIQNHTGHKLISGFPEGRRMFLNVKAFVNGSMIYEINPYDSDVGTLKGLPHASGSPALEPSEEYVDQLVYEMHTSSALTGEDHTFHMVLGTDRYKDNRIPPRGFRIDEAEERMCVPVWHGAAETNYFSAEEYAGGYDDVTLVLPVGTESIEVGLYYQTTSREFIEFLRNEINGTNGTLTGTGAGGDPAYIAQTDPWFSGLAAWGNTIWELWRNNKDLPGAAPILMTNAYVQLDVSDADGDGIPAYWETRYFSGSTNANPTADSDGDGSSEYDEYIALTSPLDSSSVLRLGVDRQPDALDFSFDSFFSRLYQLSFSSNLVSGTWSSIPPRRAGNDGLLTIRHTNAVPSGFYRVMVERP